MTSLQSTLRIALVALLSALLLVAAVAPAEAAPGFRTKARRTRPNPDVVLYGGGWGHGVGMSQYGAYAMAQAGKSYPAILRHYYRGVDVRQRRMPRRVRVGLSSARTALGVQTVSGRVPWLRCASRCRRITTQPSGRTWVVSLLSDGRWQLKQGRRVLFRGARNQRLEARFNRRVIRTYNPNTGTARYRWGELDLRRSPSGGRAMAVVVDIPSIEKYLRGLGEVPNSWGIKGMAALKAQAVTARSYTLRKHNENGGYTSSCLCTVVATPLNQAYTGYDKETADYGELWVRAVDQTAGVVATYRGTPIEAFYSSSHGGRSENSEDSWAYSATIPYLRSRPDPWSADPRANNRLASWVKVVTNRQFANFTGTVRQVRTVAIHGRTDGGTPLRLRVTGVDGSGRFRSLTRRGRNKDIVGIDLRSAFSFSGEGMSLSTLPSQQIRRIGLRPFIDDDGSSAEYAIVYAAEAGLIAPRSGRRFGVSQRVSRADLAVALYRMLAMRRSTRDYFRDDETLPRAVEIAINAVHHAGIMDSPRRRQFRPRDDVTRVATAVALRRGLELPLLHDDRFTDDDALTGEPSINRIAQRRIMTGCTARRFCPGGAVSRAQLATYLFRSVELYR